MTRRRHAVIQVICAFLLLVAQQGALSHQIWHAGSSSSAHSEVSALGDKSPEPKQTSLCDLHASLGTVLGTATGSASVIAPEMQSRMGFVAGEHSIASLSPLAPSSRGPPLFL